MCLLDRQYDLLGSKSTNALRGDIPLAGIVGRYCGLRHTLLSHCSLFLPLATMHFRRCTASGCLTHTVAILQTDICLPDVRSSSLHLFVSSVLLVGCKAFGTVPSPAWDACSLVWISLHPSSHCHYRRTLQSAPVNAAGCHVGQL